MRMGVREATVPERALMAILERRNEHAGTWRGEPESRWLVGLVEEVAELAAALEGQHAHSPDWELTQIASICLNWLEYRMQLGTGKPEADLTVREALEAMVNSVREGAGVCDGRVFAQGEDALRQCS